MYMGRGVPWANIKCDAAKITHGAAIILHGLAIILRGTTIFIYIYLSQKFSHFVTLALY